MIQRMDGSGLRVASEPVYSVAMPCILKYGLSGPSPERSSYPSILPLIRVKPWRPEMWAVFVLIGWMAWGELSAPGYALAAGGTGALRSGTFDRTALQNELSRSLSELRAWSDEQLRTYGDRLAQLQASLEGESALSPSERDDLNQRLLTRAAQVGLLLRERARAPAAVEGKRGASVVESGPVWLVGLAGWFTTESGLLLGLVGGLVIAFALGNLFGYRRGARQASYYGEADPRFRFLRRPAAPSSRGKEPGRITLAMIRGALSDGRTVLLQLGYDIAPSRRSHYQDLVRQMQEALDGAQGLTHSAWEDPRHPHRFYELLVCQRLEALDTLTVTEGLLAKLGEEIEACRLSGGLILRRVWWSVPAGSKSAGSHLPIPGAASIRGGVS